MAKNISSHVLDTATGFPASDMFISLYRYHNQTGPVNDLELREDWIFCASAVTNVDGRAKFNFDSFPNPSYGEEPGVFKVIFRTQDYFLKSGTPCFYPKAEIIFRIADPTIHYHIPLLISPFGYSTYKGS
jgi:5-hydroxyisourate hydrolase